MNELIVEAAIDAWHKKVAKLCTELDGLISQFEKWEQPYLLGMADVCLLNLEVLRGALEPEKKETAN